jgi:hypothetical protein
MSIKSFAAKIFAKVVVTRTKRWASQPEFTQQRVFTNLIALAKETEFGKDHHFESIKTFQDFANQVPVRDYEALKPYVEKVVDGEVNILWPGKPLYLLKPQELLVVPNTSPLQKHRFLII